MKYLIVANGPFLSRTIISALAEERIIVALDGASDKLAKIDLLPQIILGDFDSVENIKTWGIKKTFEEIDDRSVPYTGKYQIQIVPAKDQDLSDLVKAIRYCDKHQASQIDIVCATGGRIDHAIANMRALRSEYRAERPLYIHSENQSLFYCKDNTAEIHGEPNDYCSVMAFPAAKFSSKGLKYNGHHFPLELGFSESFCNQLAMPKATILVSGEALIVHPPMTQAQRVFSQHSYREQLQILLKEQNPELIETSERNNKNLSSHSL